MAGHSLGEYTALVVAGSLMFEDAVRLVRKRGQYMQQAVPVGEGGMAAVLGLSGKQVIKACWQASAAGVIEAVNLNCPGQVVVAGDTAGLKAVEPLLKEAGARRIVPLSVSAPFHSSLMVLLLAGNWQMIWGRLLLQTHRFQWWPMSALILCIQAWR
ncbi:MAG: ACP S-malonyltransferase [Candidatus Syntrophopropionicum ammoniitolerans]